MTQCSGEHGHMHLKDLERLYSAIGEVLKHLPPDADRRAAIRAVRQRLGVPTPEGFISTYLTGEAGADMRWRSMKAEIGQHNHPCCRGHLVTDAELTPLWEGS
jgi:hypothetical protein